MPAVAVLGVGAVASPVSSVSEVYHNKLSPVAVNASAGWSTQYWTSELFTDGADGRALTITVAVVPVYVVVIATLQFPRVTSVKAKEVFELTPFTGTVAVPPAGMVTVLVKVPSS